MEKEQKPEQQKPTDRERIADKVLDIFSDSPKDMEALVDLLKKLENNPLLHPEKAGTNKKEDAGKSCEEKEK